MNRIWTIARKELHGFFHSPVALIFLGIFLGVTVFTFFWQEDFFARGLADVRPMFEWMPILLILLVAALTMRMWSEEQRSGTIEVLLTLPIPAHSLVLGKFLAGFLLVAIGLAMTLPIPITVSMMGEMDWGPVIGGYLAALLLAGAYLSLGLCVSSATDNPLLALFGTGLGCGVLYAIGMDDVAGERSAAVAEVLRGLGSGSRFESVARGVLDVRDLAYYLGLTAFFVVVNIALLKAKRWGDGRASRLEKRAAMITAAFTLANAVALSAWLWPVSRARIDMTTDGLYSLAGVTEDLVRSADQPIVIKGYFSERIHPLIDPLLPEIRDLLREYEVAGDGNVIVELVDPDGDEDLEKEAFDDFGVQAQQFPIATRKKQELVNAYFNIVVQYGGEHEVLGLGEMIRVIPGAVGEDVQVELGNLEYELTKAIKRTIYGFQDIDAVFAALGEPVKLTAYVSEGVAPNLEASLDQVSKVADEFTERSSGQMTFERVIPKTKEDQERLLQEVGIEPLATLAAGSGGMQLRAFYFHFVLEVGDRAVLLSFPDDASEDAVRDTLEAGLRQALPGFIKTVGLVTPPAPSPPNPQMAMQMGQSGQPPQRFNSLRQRLSESHLVKSVSLESGRVDDDIDVLILAGPENLGEDSLKAVDQYLMRGGSVIALVGQQRIAHARGDLSTEPVNSGLTELLASYGVRIGSEIVMDTRSDLFAVVDPLRRRAEPAEAPYVLRVERKGLSRHLTTSDLPGVLVHYASPLKVERPSGADDEYRSEVLLRSSGEAWLSDDSSIGAATSLSRPETVEESEAGPHPIGVAISGPLLSHFAQAVDETSEDDEASSEAPASAGANASGDDDGDAERLLTRSPPDTRLVVIGSSSMVADTPLGLSEELARVGGSPLVQNNLTLVQNLVDWAVADTDLLKIRARSAESRLLEIDEAEASKWEYINYFTALVMVLAIFAVTVARTRARSPMELVPRSALEDLARAEDGDTTSASEEQ